MFDLFAALLGKLSNGKFSSMSHTDNHMLLLHVYTNPNIIMLHSKKEW